MILREFRGVYAIIPTPAREGAERWDAAATVDLDETARVVERLLADGVAGLIALGTTGECATLTNEEYDVATDAILSTVRGRVPTLVGTSALGLHEVVRRVRHVRALGATGTLLGLPMWQPCTLDMAVAFYAAVSEAYPDLTVMVYANARAFRFDFPAEFWARLAERAPTVTAAKFSNAERFVEARGASRGRITFMPSERRVRRFARLAPGSTTALWATAAAMGPSPAMALMEAILAGDDARAERIDADVAWAHETIEPVLSDPATFASYNIQIEKIRIDAAGYCRAGPIRPPYQVIPEELAEAARECGRRWAVLCRRYAGVEASP